MFLKFGLLLVLGLGMALASDYAGKLSKHPKMESQDLKLNRKLKLKQLSSELHERIHKHHHGLVKLQQQSVALSAASPLNAPDCFSYYNPKLNAITDTYEQQYEICQYNYEYDTNNINAGWYDERQALNESIGNSCNVLGCSTIVGTVEAFECFAQEAAKKSKELYELSSNATDTVTYIKRDFDRTETQRSLCINEAEKNYVQQTTRTYEDLNACLRSETTPTWTEIPTTTAYIEYTTTEDPDGN